MITSVAVVIPVADEEELLGRCLTAVLSACGELSRQGHSAVRSRVVAVLDSCTDASAAVAAEFAEVETVCVRSHRVGSARLAGCERVLAGFPRPRELWLAGTDADSRVPIDWLSGMLELADSGADVVLGTVRPVGDLPPDAIEAYQAGYLLGDGHPHVHGANFGIRASTYLAAGGWPELATGEDHALLRRASAVGGVRIKRTGALPVDTSTRLEARAPYGYSSHLRGLVARSTGRGCPP